MLSQKKWGFKALERVSNIAVIVTAVVVICSVFVRRDHSENGDRLGARQMEAKLRERVVSNRQLLPRNSTVSCILALSTKCIFCEQNAPFYHELGVLRKPAGFSLVGVFPQEQSEAAEYLRSKEIGADGVISTSLEELGVQATPTILLVDPQGHTLAAWVGVLDKARQNEVLERLSQSAVHLQKESQE